MSDRPVLRGLPEICRFLRDNRTPIHVIGPTPYSLLGLDQWVGGLDFISYFDVFDGAHPRVFVPRRRDPARFGSIEAMTNHLLRDPDVVARLRARPGGKAIFTMFDDQTMRLCDRLGLGIAMPPAALRRRLDSKIEAVRLAAEAGIACVPHAIGEADCFADLMHLARDFGLGSDLVVQTPYGDSGRTTFFIRSEDDWDRVESRLVGQKLRVMTRIDHLPGTIEGCATRHGTLVGPVMSDLTGFDEITPYRGGWCGNDISTGILPEGVAHKVRQMARRLGDRLHAEGYRGVFCLDFLLDSRNQRLYLGELNPRISGATAPTNLITATHGGCPLFLFHLLEFMEVDYRIDPAELQARWRDHGDWTQLILKRTEAAPARITAAPPSGIWRMEADGRVAFLRPALDAASVGGEDEAFYLPVHGAGDHCYLGADLGCLLARGRMQAEGRRLTDRARAWNAGLKAAFATENLPAEMQTPPPTGGSGRGKVV